jgi:hypothetical protein
LIKDDPQAVDVAAHILLALCLLWGHIIYAPDHAASHGHFGIEAITSDAKIGQQDMGVELQQDILRFNIAVNNAFLVRVLYSIAEWHKQWQRFLQCKRGLAVLQQITQSALADQWHDEIEPAQLISKLDERQDMRVREPGDDMRLAQKALAKWLISSKFGADDFQGYLAAKSGALFGAIDFGHATFADKLYKFVITQACALCSGQSRHNR